jgi:hypothetical protein
VIEQAGMRFRLPSASTDDRLLYVGDDEDRVPLEVMAVELSEESDLLVIHAMELREKYRPYYEEAKKWRD